MWKGSFVGDFGFERLRASDAEDWVKPGFDGCLKTGAALRHTLPASWWSRPSTSDRGWVRLAWRDKGRLPRVHVASVDWRAWREWCDLWTLWLPKYFRSRPYNALIAAGWPWLELRLEERPRGRVLQAVSFKLENVGSWPGHELFLHYLEQEVAQRVQKAWGSLPRMVWMD